MAKQDSARITIGPGKAVYPALKRPDTKFDELGQYKADIAIPSSEAEPLIKKLQEIHKAHTGKAAKASDNPMFYVETDANTGEETGRVVFKCRVKNKRRKDGELWDRRPKLFSADLKPVDVNPWGGSTMVVSAEVYCWEAGGKKGVSLQPMGVQILELVSGGDGADPEGMGFSKRDGFTAGDDEDEVANDFVPADGDDDGDY